MLGISIFSSFFFYSLSLVTFSNLNLVLFRFHMSEKSLLFLEGRGRERKRKKDIEFFNEDLKKKKKICIIRTFESLDTFLYGHIASYMETSLFFTSDL